MRGVEPAQRFLAHFSDLVLADGASRRSYSWMTRETAWDSGDAFGVCNLYSMTGAQTAVIELVEAMTDSTGNVPSLPGIFPDQAAPVVRNTADGRELTMMRWGMPSPSFALKNRKTDMGHKDR